MTAPLWRFSSRSRDRLAGVDARLVAVAERALQLSPHDFGVTEGVRSASRQAALLAAGASSTMNSRHLSGHAIDVAVYLGDRVSWELPLYCAVAAAFRSAAIETGTAIRWGGCWALLSTLPPDADGIEDAVERYSSQRRAMGRRALIDGPHFEIPALPGG